MPVDPKLAWGAVPVPYPGNFNSIEARTPDDVWAVGDTGKSPTKPFIAHWDGVRWTSVAVPVIGPGDHSLTSVDAIAANDAWAIGNYKRRDESYQIVESLPLILHWDGTSWRNVSPPQLSGGSYDLNDVEALSAGDAWAVGTTSSYNDRKPIIVHWDGRQWDIKQAPGQGALDAISAASPDDIWAVGGGGRAGRGGAFALHWAGTSWQDVSPPKPSMTRVPAGFGGIVGQLNDVAAVSSTDVWAVGSATTPTDCNGASQPIYHWDGTSWQVAINIPPMGCMGTYLAAIEATAPNDVWVASSGGFLHWYGSTWKAVPFPSVEQESPRTYPVNPGVPAISATGPRDVWAVIRYSDAQVNPESGVQSARYVFHYPPVDTAAGNAQSLAGQDQAISPPQDAVTLVREGSGFRLEAKSGILGTITPIAPTKFIQEWAPVIGQAPAATYLVDVQAGTLEPVALRGAIQSAVPGPDADDDRLLVTWGSLDKALPVLPGAAILDRDTARTTPLLDIGNPASGIISDNQATLISRETVRAIEAKWVGPNSVVLTLLPEGGDWGKVILLNLMSKEALTLAEIGQVALSLPDGNIFLRMNFNESITYLAPRLTPTKPVALAGDASRTKDWIASPDGRQVAWLEVEPSSSIPTPGRVSYVLAIWKSADGSVRRFSLPRRYCSNQIADLIAWRMDNNSIVYWEAVCEHCIAEMTVLEVTVDGQAKYLHGEPGRYVLNHFLRDDGSLLLEIGYEQDDEAGFVVLEINRDGSLREFSGYDPDRQVELESTGLIVASEYQRTSRSVRDLQKGQAWQLPVKARDQAVLAPGIKWVAVRRLDELVELLPAGPAVPDPDPRYPTDPQAQVSLEGACP